MSEWQPIETAPKDGMPVWVRGWDWGKPGTSHHAGFAYWDDGRWVWYGPDGGTATYLVEWRERPHAST